MLEHGGSATINISGGTIVNKTQTYSVYVDTTAHMVITGGTITNSYGTAALGSRSTNGTEVIKVTGGTITSNTGHAVFIERIASGISYVRLYGGTLTAKNSSAVYMSSDTTGYSTVYVGNSSTTYSQTAVTLISGTGYALSSGVAYHFGIQFGNGRIYAKQSSTTPAGSGCSISVSRSRYTRRTTGTYTVSGISGLYQSILTAN